MEIKDRIRKLLRLAESPNENEARAALLKAKELMAAHKLNEADFIEKEEAELVHLECTAAKWTTDSGNLWIASLCQLICEEHLCVAAWSTPARTRTHTLIITGLREDAELCKEIIEYAVGFVRGRTKKLARRHADDRAAINSYGMGFTVGLKLAYEEQKEEHPEWGLVVVEPSEVRDYKEGLETKEVKTRKSNFNPLAYAQGQMDGQDFNSRKAITA